MNIIKIKAQLEDGASLPLYATDGAAGADVRSSMDAVLLPGSKALIATGLRLAIPEGWEVQVRPRSGLAAKYGVTVVNTPGTIDSDYRGEIKVILINHGPETFVVNKGDRIAQLILSPVFRMEFDVAPLDETERGEGGFGSTSIS
jgi:dUTP pyrophosphatase